MPVRLFLVDEQAIIFGGAVTGIPAITMRRGRIFPWARMRRSVARSSDKGPLVLCPCRGCIIATCGYDFREPQVPTRGARHVSETQRRDLRDRHRYRGNRFTCLASINEARSHCGRNGRAARWRHGLPNTLLDRDGGLRRCASSEPEPQALGQDACLMPVKYSKRQKNDFRDAEESPRRRSG